MHIGHNNTMHAKPDLRVLLKWMIYRSGSVIVAVLQRKYTHFINDKSNSEDKPPQKGTENESRTKQHADT